MSQQQTLIDTMSPTLCYSNEQSLYYFVTPDILPNPSAAEKYRPVVLLALVRLAPIPVLHITDWPLFHWPLVRLALSPIGS
jgi:hypothetical protein